MLTGVTLIFIPELVLAVPLPNSALILRASTPSVTIPVVLPVKSMTMASAVGMTLLVVFSIVN